MKPALKILIKSAQKLYLIQLIFLRGEVESVSILLKLWVHFKSTLDTVTEFCFVLSSMKYNNYREISVLSAFLEDRKKILIKLLARCGDLVTAPSKEGALPFKETVHAHTVWKEKNT